MKEEVLQWARCAGVRALKTAAQAAIAVIGSSIALGGVDWALAGSSAALAAIVSVLTSVAGIPEVEDGASVRKIAERGEE